MLYIGEGVRSSKIQDIDEEELERQERQRQAEAAADPRRAEEPPTPIEPVEATRIEERTLDFSERLQRLYLLELYNTLNTNYEIIRERRVDRRTRSDALRKYRFAKKELARLRREHRNASGSHSFLTRIFRTSPVVPAELQDIPIAEAEFKEGIEDFIPVAQRQERDPRAAAEEDDLPVAQLSELDINEELEPYEDEDEDEDDNQYRRFRGAPLLSSEDEPENVLRGGGNKIFFCN